MKMAGKLDELYETGDELVQFIYLFYKVIIEIQVHVTITLTNTQEKR